MKKIILIMVVGMVYSQVYAGCDMCSMYLGLNPNYNKNSIGLRYKYSTYTDNGMYHHSTEGAHHHHEGMDETKYTREFQTIELAGTYYPVPRLQLMVFVPYMSNRVYAEDVVQDEINGMGDVSLLGRYQLYNTSSDTASFRQRIFAGAGVKLPTGVYDEPYNDGTIDPHIQPGTGSTDVLFSVGYLLRYGNFGFNSDFNYKLNMANKYDYRFSDRFSNASTLFYTLRPGSFVLLPNVGMYLETAGYDTDHQTEMIYTNGTIINSVFGVDLYQGRFAVNINYQLPVKVDLNDPSADHQGRIMTGVNYSF